VSPCVAVSVSSAVERETLFNCNVIGSVVVVPATIFWPDILASAAAISVSVAFLTDREIAGEALQIVEKAINNRNKTKIIRHFCKTCIDFNEWNPPYCELMARKRRLHTLLLLECAQTRLPAALFLMKRQRECFCIAAVMLWTKNDR